MSRKPEKFRVEPGGILSHCTDAEAARFGAQWLATYGADRAGVNAKAYPWHIFSAGRYPCTEADRALSDYEREEAVAFVVLSNDLRSAVITSVRPERCTWIDYLVFPPNLAWTFARTHEEGWLGPYFAKHPRYDTLNAENAAAIRKQREIALARAKGWV